jgi:hypothetical protein
MGLTASGLAATGLLLADDDSGLFDNNYVIIMATILQTLSLIPQPHLISCGYFYIY